jgi:hypothetical protein
VRDAANQLQEKALTKQRLVTNLTIKLDQICYIPQSPAKQPATDVDRSTEIETNRTQH